MEEELAGEARQTGDPDPVGTRRSAVTKWAAVVIAGVVCLFLLVVLLAAARLEGTLTYAGAVLVATIVGGRAGGVRGMGQWLLAAILIFAVAIALVYLAVLAVVSQITGP